VFCKVRSICFTQFGKKKKKKKKKPKPEDMNILKKFEDNKPAIDS
jgi:hypothetical protein